MEHYVSEPVSIMPFQLYVPGQARPGAPIRDFRPVVVPADTPEEELPLTVEEVPSEDGGEDEDPKGDTVIVSANSSKKTADSRKDVSQKEEEKSVTAGTAGSASRPVVPSPPTSL